ncbi:MAG TPA: polyphosphate kinase 2 family protein [Anaerolineaceae bacterium]|nr:polyphosphate kinase 2 family protein [Anaerolineaceae bacterium]
MLEKIDLNQQLSREEYKAALKPLQIRLLALEHELYERKRSMVLVFEGWDAAGKGGAIKRLTRRLDSRGYEVLPIGAPEGEDKTHHYLWRFWRRLKPPGEKQIQIFDRSWYGRVLVERVEAFTPEEHWKRAYREINEFERLLVSSGMILNKFWLHISPEEQLARFESRKEDPVKAWKLTDEDWRNRQKRDAYEAAVEDMLIRTSTLIAPWTVVEANDKYFARVKVLRTVVDTLESELGKGRRGKKNGKS